MNRLNEVLALLRRPESLMAPAFVLWVPEQRVAGEPAGWARADRRRNAVPSKGGDRLSEEPA